MKKQRRKKTGYEGWYITEEEDGRQGKKEAKLRSSKKE